MIVPSEDMNNLTVYKGSKKPIRGDKECVLIFNHDLNKFTLEKFSSNIGVKKTRLIYTLGMHRNSDFPF